MASTVNTNVINLELSSEQNEFITEALDGKNILVDACIGSGKTTSIQQLCNAFPPDKRILYLTYNRLLKLDAQAKIKSSNTTVTNYHGFAMGVLRKANITCGIPELVYTFNRMKPPIDMSYHETHNALLDALDELEIMRRLGHSIEQYARPRSVSQPVTRKAPDTRLKTAVSVSPETDAPADYFLKGTLAQGVPEKTVAPRHELSSELKSFISTALSYDASPLIEEAVPLRGYQEAHASLLAGEELLTKLKALVSTSPTSDEARNALRDFYEDEVMRALREIPVESLSHRKSGIRVNALKDSGYTNMRQIYRLNYNGLLAINGIGPKNAENIFAEASHMAREVRTKIAAKPCFAKTPAGKKAVRDYCRYKWAIKIHTSIEGILAAEEKLLDDYCYVAAPASDILRWTFTLSRKKKEAALQAATALQKRITNTTRELVHTAEILYAHCSEISFEEAWTDYTKVPDEYNAWLTKNRTQDA